MAIALVQSRGSIVTGSNSSTLSFTGLPTVGNLIIVALSTYAGNIGTSAVSDNQSNSYTRRTIAQPTGQDTDVAIFSAIATTSSGTFTITVNPDGSSSDFTFAIMEFSGNASTPFDQQNSNINDAGGTSVTSGSATPAEDNEVWIAAMTHCGTNRTLTETVGTRVYENEGGTSNMPINVTYGVQTTKTAVNAAWTIGTGSVVWGACIATFKASATAPTTVTLSAATITAAGQALTVVPGACSVALNAATITAAGQVITLPSGAVTVPLSAATLTATGQALSVVPGARSIALNAAALTLSATPLTVDPVDINPGEPTWTDDFISQTAYWDHTYEPTHRTITTVDNISVIDHLVPSTASAAAYYDTSLHSPSNAYSSGVFEARLRCTGNAQTDDDVGTRGWGFWNGSESFATMVYAWFWCASPATTASVRGFRAIIYDAANGIVFNQAITNVDITLWHTYAIRYSDSGFKFYVDGVVKAESSYAGIDDAMRHEIWMDNYGLDDAFSPFLCDPTVDQHLYVDWVKSYTLANWTPGVVVTLNAAGIIAGGQALTVTPGAVSTTLAAAAITAGGQALTVVPGARAITLSAAALSASGQTLTIVPGAVSTTLAAASLSASGQALTLVPGAVTLTLSAVEVTASGQSITIDPGTPGGTVVTLSAATLSAAGQALSIIPGAVSTTLAAASVSATGQAITLVPGVVSTTLAAAGLTATGQSLAIVPGAVSTSLAAATLAAIGQTITISAISPEGITVELSAAILAASGQALTLLPGGVAIPLAAGGISASGQAITLLPGAVSIPLSAASLAVQGQPILLVPGAVIILLSTGAITATGQVIDVQSILIPIDGGVYIAMEISRVIGMNMEIERIINSSMEISRVIGLDMPIERTVNLDMEIERTIEMEFEV